MTRFRVGIALWLLATAFTVADTLRSRDVNLAWLQAEAFLAGHLDIPYAASDVADYRGAFFVPFPPLPALVLVPFAALHLSADVTLLLALVLAAACERLLRGIFAALGCTPEQSLWLRAAFLAGTGFWLMVLWSRGVWYFATVIGVTLTLAAMREALTRGRAWRVGLFAGLAVLSRQMAVYSLLFLLPALWTHALHGDRRRRIVAVAQALAVFGVVAAAYPLFNALRFDSPWETGYQFIRHAGHLQPRVAAHGLFSLAYVPENLIRLFLQGPHVTFSGPDLARIEGPDPFGTSLTFASPFLFLGLAARGRRALILGAASGAALCLAHQLLYYSQGWVQWNTQRFTLDFIPLLLVPLALALPRVDARLWKGAVLYAIVLNFIMIFVVPNLSRLLR